MTTIHFKPLVAILLPVLLAGCASNYSLKEFSPTPSGPKSAFVDIKQRAVLSAVRPGQPANKADVVMCAEPSPDAISALASEIGLDAKYKESVAATLGIAQQESASFVGLRTQTIQLLRDGMFRLCEGYMSGALSSADFAWLSRRYQRNMVALLSIEQLTRVVQAPAAALATQGMASAARSATAIQTDIEEIDKTKLRLEKEKAAIDEEMTQAKQLPDTDASKATKVKEIQQRLDDKTAAIARAAELKSALLEGLKSARGVLVSGSSVVQIVSVTDPRTSVSDAVATKIAELASQVLAQDDLPTLCFQLITGERTIPTVATAALTTLMNRCAQLVDARTARELKDARNQVDVEGFFSHRERVFGLEQLLEVPKIDIDPLPSPLERSAPATREGRPKQ